MAKILASFFCFALISISVACQSAERVIISTTSGDVVISISSSKGQLSKGNNELVLSFADASGKAIDVRSASLNFQMPAMGAMAEMNNRAALTTTDTPGKYRAVVEIEMAGTWEAQVEYEGPQGSGQASMTLQAK